MLMAVKNWENQLWNSHGLKGIPGRMLRADVAVIILDGNIAANILSTD